METSFGSSSPDLVAPGANGDRPAKLISLVLAGHHPLTLCGLSQVFEKEPDCEVVAVCTDGEAVLDTLRRRHADIVILDLNRNAAFKVLRRIQRAHLATRAVVLAADDKEMAGAGRLGASAIIVKQLPPEAFVTSIRAVQRGEISLDEHGGGRLVGRILGGRSSMRHVSRQLTPREAEIARLAVLGISTRDIAARLDVKQGTVKIHLHSIYEKLDVGGRLGLILFARRRGLA